MNYDEFSQKTESNKIGLAHIFPRQRWKEWTLDSLTIYKAIVPYLPSDVFNSITQLTQIGNPNPALNEWYFDPLTKYLYLNVGHNPKVDDIIITYKMCFSTAPLNMPHDLDIGYDVEWLPLIRDLGDLKLELDYENAGIALETSSTIALENNDGYFDSNFDTLIWENQRAIFYSYGLELDPSQSKIIFDGFIENKTFEVSQIKFSLKDAFKRLREKVQMPIFSALDGVIDDSTTEKPKRRIFGRIKNLDCTGIDKTLSGYELTGTFVAQVGTTTVTGTGSDLLDELSPEDEIFYTFNDTQFKYKVQSVDSNSQFTLSQAIEAPIDGELTVSPEIPYRRKNRTWHVAGHKCKNISTTITEFLTPTRVRVADTSNFEAGDLINYDGGLQFLNVQRISDDIMVFDQALGYEPVGGEVVFSPAIRAAYFRDNLLVQGRDYDFTSTATDTKLIIDELAEFNITRPFITPYSFTFTNASRTVTCATANADLTAILKSRDWIRADSVTRPEWYEILEVKPAEIILRTAFSTATFTGQAQRKNVEYINDDSLITVDANGLEDSDGNWINNASRSIKYILENDLTLTNLNYTAFTEAETDAPELISYAIPETNLNEAPVIRDVITNINKSVFGALYQDTNFKFTFSVLQADKADDMDILREDDVVSYSGGAKPNIANKVRILYQPFIDVFNESPANKIIEFDNYFVNSLSGIKNTKDQTVYLYRDQDAQDYAERLAFLSSVTNQVLTVKGKLNLSKYGLGEKVLLDLDRIYKRYGSEDNLKIAIIYGVQSDDLQATIMINDFNGMFTRVPAIAPDDADDYSLAESEDIAKFGFIVDDDTETPDGLTNSSLGNNLIG